MKFSEKLVELRTAAGMSQTAMAEASGVSLATVRNYEQGRTVGRINFASVVALARALGVSCDAFAGCLDVMHEVSPKPRTKRKA